VLYEGKRVVGITFATLKILGTMPREVWCISLVYVCYCMIVCAMCAALSSVRNVHFH
jgi:hypothetical protein